MGARSKPTAGGAAGDPSGFELFGALKLLKSKSAESGYHRVRPAGRPGKQRKWQPSYEEVGPHGKKKKKTLPVQETAKEAAIALAIHEQNKALGLDDDLTLDEGKIIESKPRKPRSIKKGAYHGPCITLHL